jgi:hypothetical protein
MPPTKARLIRYRSPPRNHVKNVMAAARIRESAPSRQTARCGATTQARTALRTTCAISADLSGFQATQSGNFPQAGTFDTCGGGRPECLVRRGGARRITPQID